MVRGAQTHRTEKSVVSLLHDALGNAVHIHHAASASNQHRPSQELGIPGSKVFARPGCICTILQSAPRKGIMRLAQGEKWGGATHTHITWLQMPLEIMGFGEFMERQWICIKKVWVYCGNGSKIQLDPSWLFGAQRPLRHVEITYLETKRVC